MINDKNILTSFQVLSAASVSQPGQKPHDCVGPQKSTGVLAAQSNSVGLSFMDDFMEVTTSDHNSQGSIIVELPSTESSCCVLR